MMGADLTTSQDTPVASKKENKCIVFNEEVHIQKSLESLPNGQFSGMHQLLYYDFKTIEKDVKRNN